MSQSASRLEKLKRHIGFGEPDVANLQYLGAVLADALETVTDNFYQRLFTDPQAKLLFREGEPQIARQRRAFAAWLSELFCGRYDVPYFESRVAIGRTHVRVGMPQHYMFTAFEIVRQELERAIQQAEIPEPEARMRSLNKLLTLETAMMLESYKEHYSSAIRDEERIVAEEKLTRSEHLAQIGQLAASLAHEIKNPLAGISGAIQVIRDGMLPEDPHRNVVREILAQIARLDDAVKDLLVYARPNKPQLAVCNLAAVVDRVVKMHAGVPALRHVTLRVLAPPDLPAVAADAGQIEQLVVNLLFNAGHASSRGDEIDISLEVIEGAESGDHEQNAGQRVRMSVSDRGHGMDPQTRSRAFEPFFTTKAKGTGLGLPICRRIVEAHGGTMTLESQVGQGTRVTLELPVRQN